MQNSSKMVISDKLLASMKEKGSEFFSQMSCILDILQDYCLFRQYSVIFSPFSFLWLSLTPTAEYCHIDGGTAHNDHITAIDKYNKPVSEEFIFLLTTRDGGLGINLTTADIVVLYDSDWNPQADLQPMDRRFALIRSAKRSKSIFRFITENSVEERMLECAAQKLHLDQLVIQHGLQQQLKAANKEELMEMITAGYIIQRGEECTVELNSKYKGLNSDDLNNFKSDATAKKAFNLLSLLKRERKTNYSVDSYFKDTLRASPSKTDNAPKPNFDQNILFQHVNGITAPLREPLGPEDTPRSSMLNVKLRKTSSIAEKTLKEVKKYYLFFKWKQLAGPAE
ncbi:hypothetical protein PILCRDRAFT_7131 [Piloderma croceum F 1598]|uniref:Helicase C-terminal domain-containing protein n=1 Tax=Piloderma croceum (strain F 1598) TaxID=765440 RepID=A0A0C3FH95_PILCF|nr:hypothetical protein PILCRDRAFT_7131 [Piloderma croceum F 1598]